MMELKSDPPNLGFWAPDLTYLQIRPKASKTISCVQDKVETVEKRQNQCKKIKFFIFKSNFLYDGAKKWPPNLGFWAPALTYLQIRPNASQKNSCVRDKVETVEKRQNQCKKIKFFLFKSNFLYDGAKKWPPKLGFWAPALTYLQIRPNASQKIAVCKIKWKQLKRDKISAKKSNFLFLNQILYMMELKIDPPT